MVFIVLRYCTVHGVLEARIDLGKDLAPLNDRGVGTRAKGGDADLTQAIHHAQ